MNRAFTLIELLTVMAVSAILLTVIAVPIVQSFNITRSAQGFADAQDRARRLISQIEREIGNSAGVRDNSGAAGSLVATLPDETGAPVQVTLPHVKLDILMPATGDPRTRVGAAFVDPDTGKVDPTLTTPKGDPVLPGTAGDTMVRYFVARRDPFSPYNNPYVRFTRPDGSRWLAQAGGRDNLYVLYRAEVQPFVWRVVSGVPTRVVNTAFFVDGDRDGSATTSGIVMDDPFFMEPDGTAIYPSPQAGDPADRSEMIRNWLRVASVVTEVSRYDMVMPVFDRGSLQVRFDGGRPVVVPLVRFQPTRMNTETARGMLAVRPSEESDNMEKVGPDVYETQYGSWSDATVSVFPSLFNPGTGPGRSSAGAVQEAYAGGTVVQMGVAPGAGSLQIFGSAGPFFDVTNYLSASASGAPYAFTSSVNAGALPDAAARALFMPFVPDAETGRIRASFDVRDVGVDLAVPFEARIPSNTTTEPGVVVGPTVTPADPAFTAGPAWHTYGGLNQRFARLWHQWDSLFPDVSLAPARDDVANGVRRFIDLRVLRQAGASGAPGPLEPGLFPRASIVPGSEVVVGPDQNPGPNYGRLVRYTRVPNVDSVTVGPNQYKINYTHRQEPDWSLLGFTSVNYDQRFYDPTDFLSAVLQARYRVGYLELNSRFGEPIPGVDAGASGNIYVSYRFQFTEPRDVVSVDYGSSQLMEVVLTIRNYPQTSIPNPQMVTVRGSAAIRNTVR